MNSITVINYYYLLKRGFPQFAMPGGDVRHMSQCTDSLLFMATVTFSYCILSNV